VKYLVHICERVVDCLYDDSHILFHEHTGVMYKE
jgi:hypothetical protein